MLLPARKFLIVVLLMMSTPSMREQRMTTSEFLEFNSKKSLCVRNTYKVSKEQVASVRASLAPEEVKTSKNIKTDVRFYNSTMAKNKDRYMKFTKINSIARMWRTIPDKLSSKETVMSNMNLRKNYPNGHFLVRKEFRKEMVDINMKSADNWNSVFRANQKRKYVSITKWRRRLLSETGSLPSEVTWDENDSSKISAGSTFQTNSLTIHAVPLEKETIPVEHSGKEKGAERISYLTPSWDTVTDHEEQPSDEAMLQGLDDFLRETGMFSTEIGFHSTPSLGSADSKYGRAEIWSESNTFHDVSIIGKTSNAIALTQVPRSERTPIISTHTSPSSMAIREEVTDKKDSRKTDESRMVTQQKITKRVPLLLREKRESKISLRVKRDNSIVMEETNEDEIVEDVWGQAPLSEVEQEDKMDDGEDVNNDWSLDFRASLVDAVADYFYSPCVFFLYDPGPLRDAGDTVALWQRVAMDSGRRALGLPYPQAVGPSEGDAAALPHPPLRLPHCLPGRPLVVVTSTTAVRELARSQRRWPGEARWLLLLAGTSLARVLRVLRGARLPPDCEVLLANEKGAEGEPVVLQEVLRARPRAPLQMQAWGRWQAPKRLQGPASSLVERRADLHGTFLTIAAAMCPPLERVSPLGGGALALAGLFPAMWRELQRGLNATARVVRFPDEAYGRDANGSWTGIVGAAQRGSVNVAVNSFLMSGARMKVVDFTTPVVIARAGVFVREPSEAPMRWELMATPFTRSLWLCVGAALVLLAVALAAVSRVTTPAAPAAARAAARAAASPDAYAFAKRAAYALPPDTPAALPLPAATAQPTVLSASDAMLLALGAVCNQGPQQSLTSHAGQVLTWVLHALAVIVIAAYSANLMASLALRRAELPFQDLKGLVDHGGYALGVIGGLIRNFMDATDPLLRRVYAKLLSPFLDAQPKSFGEGFERVCRGRYAFMTGTHTAGGQTAACNYAVLPRGSFPLALAMVLPQGSPLRRILNFRLESMRRSGVLRRLFLRDWPSLQPSDEARFFPVALRSVTPVLVGLGAAVAASLLLLTLVERRAARRCLRPRPCPRPCPRSCRRRRRSSAPPRNATSSSVASTAVVSGFFYRDELKPRSTSPARHHDIWM